MVQNAAGEAEGNNKERAAAGTSEEVVDVADSDLVVELVEIVGAVKTGVVEGTGIAGAVGPQLVMVFGLSSAKLMEVCCVACSVYQKIISNQVPHAEGDFQVVGNWISEGRQRRYPHGFCALSSSQIQ